MGEGGKADSRDNQNWVVLELTRAGEVRAEGGTLEAALREVLNAPSDHPIFIPSAVYSRNGHRMAIHLMEGYAFIASGLPETEYFALERESPHIKCLLSNEDTNGVPALSVIADADVREMQRRLQDAVAADICEGMQVLVTQGTYAKLEGAVVEVDAEEARILFELRSFKLIRSVPRVFLRPMGDEEEPG